MAELNKAKKRQASNGGSKAHYAGNFEQGKRNKIRRLETRCNNHPGDHVAHERLLWWKKNAYTRKGTKRVK